LPREVSKPACAGSAEGGTEAEGQGLVISKAACGVRVSTSSIPGMVLEGHGEMAALSFFRAGRGFALHQAWPRWRAGPRCARRPFIKGEARGLIAGWEADLKINPAA